MIRPRFYKVCERRASCLRDSPTNEPFNVNLYHSTDIADITLVPPYVDR